MSLKNQQYDAILRMYDIRQLQNKHEYDLRTREVYQCVPEIEELDKRLVHDSVRFAKRSLLDRSISMETLEEANKAISEEKNRLLVAAGFPADYLQMHYICPDCKDTGFIGDEKCHCFRQAMVDLLYSQSNLKNAVLSESFETFSFRYYSDDKVDPSTGLTPLSNIKKVVATAKQFVSQFDESYRNLLIYGNTGVGKTFLTNCIAKELMDSAHAVVYLTAYELFTLMEQNKFNRGAADSVISEQFNFMMDCDLLIIDDLGTELTNSFTSTQLFMCVNERHLMQKSTIISTNLSLEQIKEIYSERVFSRITSDYILLKVIGEDIRLKKLF